MPKTPKMAILSQITLTILILLLKSIISLNTLQTKLDTYLDIDQNLFSTGTTDKYFVYMVKNEIQMRSASFISFEDKNDKGDPGTRIFSEIQNITNTDCFKVSGICIFSGNGMIESYKLTTLGIQAYKTYQYREPDLAKIWFTRLAAIQGSQYFLSVGQAEHGIMRWKVKTTGSFAKLSYSEVPKYLFATDIIAFPGMIFACVTWRTYKNAQIFDFVGMNKLHSLEKVSGFPAYLSMYPKEYKLAFGDERWLKVFNYQEKTKILEIALDYYISSVQNIQNSEFLILATSEFIQVMDMSAGLAQENRMLYKKRFQFGVYNLRYNDAVNKIFIFGSGFAQGVKFESTSGSRILLKKTHSCGVKNTFRCSKPTRSLQGDKKDAKPDKYCHPFCATCRGPFSAFKCITCNAKIAEISKHEKTGKSRCVPNRSFISDHAAGEGEVQKDYKDLSWSLNDSAAFKGSVPVYSILKYTFYGLIALAIAGGVLYGLLYLVTKGNNSSKKVDPSEPVKTEMGHLNVPQSSNNPKSSHLSNQQDNLNDLKSEEIRDLGYIGWGTEAPKVDNNLISTDRNKKEIDDIANRPTSDMKKGQPQLPIGNHLATPILPIDEPEEPGFGNPIANDLEHSHVIISKKSEYATKPISKLKKRPKRPSYLLTKDMKAEKSRDLNTGVLNLPMMSQRKARPVSSGSPSPTPSHKKTKQKPKLNLKNDISPDIAHSFVLSNQPTPTHKNKNSVSKNQHNSKYTFSLKKLDTLTNRATSNTTSPINRNRKNSNLKLPPGGPGTYKLDKHGKYSKCELNSVAQETPHIALVPNMRHSNARENKMSNALGNREVLKSEIHESDVMDVMGIPSGRRITNRKISDRYDTHL